MFPRLILAIIVLAAVIAFMRKVRARIEQRNRPPPLEAKTVQCAHCEVYVPRPEAILVDGKTYCSRAHAEADSR